MGRGDNHDNVLTARDAECKAISKGIREAKKSKVPTVIASMTSFGPVAPGLPLPPGVPASFSLKQTAIMELQTGAAE